MKKKIALQWAEALRSGKYKQGKKALKYKTSAGVVRHCCLGVLCDLYCADMKKTGKAEKKRLTTGLMLKPTATDRAVFSRDVKFAGYYDSKDKIVCRHTLPTDVMKWAGMTYDDGEIKDSENLCLAEMNDNGNSFNNIADTIEADWKYL